MPQMIMWEYIPVGQAVYYGKHLATLRDFGGIAESSFLAWWQVLLTVLDEDMEMLGKNRYQSSGKAIGHLRIYSHPCEVVRFRTWLSRGTSCPVSLGSRNPLLMCRRVGMQPVKVPTVRRAVEHLSASQIHPTNRKA